MPARLLALVLPHDYIRLFEHQPSEDVFRAVKTFENPEGTREWQTPDFATHPDYFTATAQGEDEQYDLYFVQISTDKRLKVFEGDVGQSHLWVAPAGASGDTTTDVAEQPSVINE